MGSPNVDNGTNDYTDEPYPEDASCKRPEFYPCQVCGRFFTTRAMLVHKSTCLENESCKCSACRSQPKKINWESLKKKNKLQLKNSTKYVYKKKSKLNVQFQNVPGKKNSIITGTMEHNELITFKLIEESSHMNEKIIPEESLQLSNPITTEACLANNDHEYISPSSEISDVAESSLDRSMKDKFDHDCDRKLFCCFCNQHIYWESFGLHVIQHCESMTLPNEVNDLKCPDQNCLRHFSQPAMFLTHYLIHNSDHPLECSDCCCSNPMCSSSVGVIDEHGYAESDLFHCYICLTHFSHPQTVINHMRLHSKEMPYKCTVCNRSFRQIGHLQRHATTHRGDRPYKCNKCSSSFADPATLRNHERIHTGETPYVCNVCSRGFTQVGNLKRHMALHLKKDPTSTTFQSTIEVTSDENTISIINPPADIKINLDMPTEPHENDKQNGLDYTINNVASLYKIKTTNRRNRKKNGKMKVFTCTICNKVYTWKHDLTVHFRTHTGEKPYKCDLCGKKFAQSGAVRIHKDRHHSGSTNRHTKRRNNNVSYT